MVNFHKFPQEQIDLNIELSKHPELMQKIFDSNATDVGDKIGVVAAYLGIVIDGMYTESELNQICKVCTEKLFSMRTLIVLPTKH